MTASSKSQIEQSLVTHFQEFYQASLGHIPDSVRSEWGTEQIVVEMEGILTRPEQLLAQAGETELSQQMRTALDTIIRPQLRELIETIIQAPIADFMLRSDVRQARTVAIALLCPPSE